MLYRAPPACSTLGQAITFQRPNDDRYGSLLLQDLEDGHGYLFESSRSGNTGFHAGRRGSGVVGLDCGHWVEPDQLTGDGV